MKQKAIFLWIFLATGPVFAHDTWIVPDHFTVKRGATVTLDMTSGMGFPALDYAIKPDRVGRAFVRLGGRTTPLAPRSAAHSLRFALNPPREGVATIAVDLSPRSIDLTPEQVAKDVLAGLEQETFAILPHPQVLGYMRKKTENYDRWISGMAKIQAKMRETYGN